MELIKNLLNSDVFWNLASIIILFIIERMTITASMNLRRHMCCQQGG